LVFQVPATGNASLQVKSTSNAVINGQSASYQATTVATTNVALTTSATFQYLNSALAFTVAGNTQVATIYNSTTNKTYRVTYVLANPITSASITVERIAG
jgi:hypothetical protein